MNGPVRTKSRAVRVLLLYAAALCLLGLLMSTDIWWLDAAYLSVVFGILFLFSLRTVFAKWRSDHTRDVTKHGPGAAYPRSWIRWLTDDYADDKTKHR
jgi:hypothetical protein